MILAKFPFRIVRKMTSFTDGLPQANFDNIRKYLWQFGGGDIKFFMNQETGVATICLDNAEKRNAMTGQMMVKLRDCVEQLEKWKEGKAVIFYGNGDNFCSGGDLDFARASGTPQGGLQMNTWMVDALNRLHKLPIFSVCIIKGPSLGGGAELSTFCDFIIAADNVKFGYVHGRMGIIPAWGGATRLVRKIGHEKALDLLLTGKILSAQECFNIGLAQCIVPEAEALLRTEQWLSSRIQYHFTVTRAMKEVVVTASCHSEKDSMQFEKIRFPPFWGGDINKEALSKNIKHVKNKF